MREIVRSDVNNEWAHSGIVDAGDFVFINYCAGNVGQSVENQINGAFNTEFAHIGGAEGLQFQLDAIAFKG